MEEMFCLYKGASGEIEEKKSRFIANIIPVTSEEEATDFIVRTKKKYWDASHNCSAFVIGDGGMLTRCSDDGEPSGTAGRPMLEVLLREKVTNICVVVTRYFGGTLLGTGGLVRAYQAAVKEALQHCVVIHKEAGRLYRIHCDYTDYGKLQFLCQKEQYRVMKEEFLQDVGMEILVDSIRQNAFEKSVADTTGGRVSLFDFDEVIYAATDEGILFY